ncbi:46090_t:CDS:2, partial [Gigaspora margarita]
MSMHIDENILKRVRGYGFHNTGNKSQDIYEYIIGRDFKRKCISGKDFSGKCILCVNTLQQVSKLGYSTVSTTSGQEAVKLIDSEFKLLNNAYSSSTKFEMDQPMMSGLDVSRAIRAMRPPISNIPIIILTNLLTEEIQNKCIELGINDFLGKPLNIRELEKVLTKLNWSFVNFYAMESYYENFKPSSKSTSSKGRGNINFEAFNIVYEVLG